MCSEVLEDRGGGMDDQNKKTLKIISLRPSYIITIVKPVKSSPLYSIVDFVYRLASSQKYLLFMLSIETSGCFAKTLRQPCFHLFPSE